MVSDHHCITCNPQKSTPGRGKSVEHVVHKTENYHFARWVYNPVIQKKQVVWQLTSLGISDTFVSLYTVSALIKSG